MSHDDHHEQKAKSRERALRLAWSSLESHLGYTHGKKGCHTCDDKAFHRRCVKEYTELIGLIGKL